VKEETFEEEEESKELDPIQEDPQLSPEKANEEEEEDEYRIKLGKGMHHSL